MTASVGRDRFRVGEAFGYVRGSELAASPDLCDRVLAMLHRLTH